MKSIKTKITLFVISLILLSTTLTGGLGILIAERKLKANAVEIMNLLCATNTHEIDAMLAGVELTAKNISYLSVEKISSNMTDGKINEANFASALYHVAMSTANNTDGAMGIFIYYAPELAEQSRGLYAIKPLGRSRFIRMASADLATFGQADLSSVDRLNEDGETQGRWTVPCYNESLFQQTISYVVPLYLDDVVVGAVGIEVALNSLMALVEKIQAYQTGHAFLVDEQGGVFCNEHHAPGGQSKDVSSAPLSHRIVEKRDDMALYDYNIDEQAQMAALAQLRNGMTLVVAAPVAEINEGANQLKLELILSVTGTFLLGLAMSVVITNKLTKPLTELNEAAQKIANGNLETKINHYANDEIGTLAETLRKTTAHLKKHVDRVNSLAYRDALTSVRNKMAYMEYTMQMDSEIENGSIMPFAVCVFDLNNLKIVNDTFGHAMGDMLIMDTCNLICTVFKHSSVFRIGGDEFVAISSGHTLSEVEALFAQLDAHIKAYNDSRVRDYTLSLAKGLAVYQTEDVSVEAVFKRADDAMYRNKAIMKQQRSLD